ncbi:hypothetical protein SDRG_11164 [Saprolegnia diclina VS20]|uniref:Uncharacterized protein n=1 Tax=Saprolegnia diclina (strain VS20) TaxID=1156394 RepID=T0RG34_SAPDV|nr:hypothetical protein SDRG_11164 [Saprolegnia diclina VS20]EQC31243.1 hypothetical protein SDRG_11164 [Saprolegnia diclina VS20]|eukprot:XP_008615416.1 hypothetical protein SDRG_11164 [Saprolegnia diclina VS20]
MHGAVLSIYTAMSRLAAFAAIFYILFIDVTGSFATKDSIKGVSEEMFNPSNRYSQSYMLTFVQALVTNAPLPMNATTTLPPQGSASLLYLDAADPSDHSTLGFNRDGCLEPLSSDHIYTPTYVAKVLPLLLDHQSWHSINLTTDWVLVDCSYQGRTLGDTTAFKIHVLDRQFSRLTSIVIQTMVIVRPVKQWRVACGTATISTMDLSAVSWQDGALTSSQEATYDVMVGTEFPYANYPFDYVRLLNPASRSGEWNAVIIATGEPVVISGSTGTYRYSPRTQGRYNYFVWQLPANPISYLSTIQWVSVVYTVDSWAWVRYILDMGISLILGANTIVGVIASLNIYRTQHILWIPDVYPGIQAEIMIRSLLLLAICVTTDWWHLFEYCMVKCTARQSWGYSELVLEAVVRSDLQVLYLALFQLLASLLGLRLHVALLLTIYFGCYTFCDAIIAAWPLQAEAASAWLYHNYLLNTLVANGGMDMWAYHENYKTSWDVMAAQLVWYLLALAIAAAYVLLLSVHAWCTRRHRAKIHSGGSTDGRSTSGRSGRHLSYMLVKSSIKAAFDANRIFKSNAKATEATIFERHVRRNQMTTSGLVAPLTDHVIIDGVVHASHSLVWLLGFVLLADDVLLTIEDVPKLWINALLARDVFAVYGYKLNETKASIAPLAERISARSYGLGDLIALSLKPLR